MKRSHIPLALAILAALMLVCSGLGARAGLWDFRKGFTILKWAAYLGAGTLVITIIALLVPRVRTGHVTSLIVALVVAAVVVYLPWSWLQRAKGSAPIHDISTDTDRPPEFVAILPLRANAANKSEYEGPEIAKQQHETYPDIQTVTLTDAPPAAFRKAHAAADAMGWEIVAADSAAGRVEATATTTWFGFKDDVVVRIEGAQQGSRVDVRSVSRVGKGDVGTNAARIRKYVEKLKAQA